MRTPTSVGFRRPTGDEAFIGKKSAPVSLTFEGPLTNVDVCGQSRLRRRSTISRDKTARWMQGQGTWTIGHGVAPRRDSTVRHRGCHELEDAHDDCFHDRRASDVGHG